MKIRPRFPDLSTSNVVELSGETILIASSAKAVATVIRKTSRRLGFMGWKATRFWTRKSGPRQPQNLGIGPESRTRTTTSTRTTRLTYHPLGIADTDRIVHIGAKRRDPGESIGFIKGPRGVLAVASFNQECFVPEMTRLFFQAD